MARLRKQEGKALQASEKPTFRSAHVDTDYMRNQTHLLTEPVDIFFIL